MSRNPQELLKEAMELPPEARAALADSLLNSLDTETDLNVEQAWQEEIQKRMASIEDGTAEMISWEDVQAQLLRRLQRPA
jgi:putative addiction module component (TIGR02574 family)